MSQQSEIDNILSVWERRDEIDHSEGMIAYEKYHRTMARLSHHYGFGLMATTGAFCALSPNNDYTGNLRSLVTLLRGYRTGRSVERLTVSTYNACKRRAWRCLEGENFLDFTKGPKTTAFYQNILQPSDLYPVTIDGHMYSIWAGKRLRMKEVATMGFDYETVARDFRTVAFRVFVRPNQVQAILWFTWKRIHNVVYKPQLGLFCAGDQWGLLPDPEYIRPFPDNK